MTEIDLIDIPDRIRVIEEETIINVEAEAMITYGVMYVMHRPINVPNVGQMINIRRMLNDRIRSLDVAMAVHDEMTEIMSSMVIRVWGDKTITTTKENANLKMI